MGNCFKPQIEIREITKETFDKSIQCDMELTITEKSIREIEKNVDELLEDHYENDIINFVEDLINF